MGFHFICPGAEFIQQKPKSLLLNVINSLDLPNVPINLIQSNNVLKLSSQIDSIENN